MQLSWTQPNPHTWTHIYKFLYVLYMDAHTHTHMLVSIRFLPQLFQTIVLGLHSPVEANLAQSHTTSQSLFTWLPLCFVFISCIVECFGLHDKSCVMLSGLILELGTLRLQVHLLRAFETILGSQSWSNDPLVYWLDKTYFIVPVYRDVIPQRCKGCLRAFGLGRIACETTVGCRNQTIGSWEPPEKCLCARDCVTASPRIPRDPRALTEPTNSQRSESSFDGT